MEWSKYRLKGKCYPWNACIRRKERSKIKNLSFHLRNEGKKKSLLLSKQTKRYNIINDIKNRKLTEKNNKTESWFFEKLNRIDKPLARLAKKREREMIQINNIRKEGEVTTTDLMNIKSIIKEYHKQWYTHRFDHLNLRDQILERHKCQNLQL